MQKDSTSLCTQADWTVALQKAKIQDPMEKVVWALLQSAGILDMEKLIEHRPPLDKLSFWKRPAIPQREHRTHARFLTAIDILQSPLPSLTNSGCPDSSPGTARELNARPSSAAACSPPTIRTNQDLSVRTVTAFTITATPRSRRDTNTVFFRNPSRPRLAETSAAATAYRTMTKGQASPWVCFPSKSPLVTST